MKLGTFLGCVCLLLATPPLAPRGAHAHSNGGLSVALNRAAFKAGDTMVVTATLTPITPARPVDAYLVAQLPNGFMFSLQLGGALVPGIVPIARNFVPFQFEGSVAQYVVNGSEPAGPYTWLYALTEPGTLNIIGTLGQTPFTIGAASTNEPLAVIISNADTNAVAVVSLPDGSSTTYFGPKDESGIPLRISEAVTKSSDDLRVHLTLDEAGAPVAVAGSDGSRASFDYPAPDRIDLTLTAPTGASLVVSYNPQTGQILSDRRVSAPTVHSQYETGLSTAVADVEGFVLTRCGDNMQSADDVSVKFDIDPSYVELRTGVYTQVAIDLPAPELSAGFYSYEVPTQPFPRNPTLLNQIAQQVDAHFRQLCVMLNANSRAGLTGQLRNHLSGLAAGPPNHPITAVARVVLISLTAFQAACTAGSANTLVNRALDLATATGFIRVRARLGAATVPRSERFEGSITAPQFDIDLDASRCAVPRIEGQNRIVGAGSWRIFFVSQEDNFALLVRTDGGAREFRIDEDDPLLPPVEILDTNPPSGWTVDVSDWGIDPGQAYVEKTKVDENTYLFNIEVTHGAPSSPYDDAVLRFERILPPPP